MTHNDGEKELVLGNTQLLSLFFVVVALCGVVFAMGYMIGRNSAKPAPAVAESSAATGAEGQRKQPETSREAAAQTDPVPPGVNDLPQQTAQTAGDGQPVPATLPPAPVPVPAPAAVAPEVERPKPAAEKAKEYQAPGTVVGLGVPEEHASYWQVVAYSKKSDADGLVRTLRDAKFTVVLYRTPDNLFHVLVGPYHTPVPLSEAKTRLKTLGFGGVLLKKF